MFPEGIFEGRGGDGIAGMPKCAAPQIYLLAENLEQAYQKSSKLDTFENMQ